MSMGFLIGKLNKIWHFCAISIFETNTKSTIYSEHKAGAQEQPMGDLLTQCTEVCFASFFFGGFITVIVVNPPERKLAKCTSVQCTAIVLS